MVALALVHLIEKYSAQITSRLMVRLKESDETWVYQQSEVQGFLGDLESVYSHLGDWMLSGNDAQVEDHFRGIGRRESWRRVPLSQVVSALRMARDAAWSFVAMEVVPDGAVALYGRLELLQMLQRFFDRAIYYAALGYEQARA